MIDTSRLWTQEEILEYVENHSNIKEIIEEIWFLFQFISKIKIVMNL